MKKNPRKTRQKGFALIVTLSLMILLTVIAVGLLSLSSISLRSTSQASATSVARSNARLAMMLALGELQASMGTDTSVSAPASAIISNVTTNTRPHILGTWQRPSDPADPKGPDWHWQPSTSGAPNYSGKAGLFKSWLVSTATPTDATSPTLPSKELKEGSEAVGLVGNLSNDGLSTLVTAQKVKVGSIAQRGKFAWAVFDESTKAPIHLGDPATPLDAGTEIATRTAPHRVHAEVIEPEKLATLATPLNLISLDSAAIPAGQTNSEEFKKRFHDFTTDSVGLLTDTARGGLKTDLTSLFEGNVVPPTSLYPSGFTAAMGAPSWNYIRSHYLKYKSVVTSGSTPIYSATSTDLSPGGAGSQNPPGQVQAPTYERLLPVISKFQLILSMVAHHASDQGRRNYLQQNATNAQGQKDGYLKHAIPHLVYDPVVTLYNPYDVALKLTNLRVKVWNPPVGFRIYKNGVSLRDTSFYGLGSYTYGTEDQPAAPKFFTMILSDGTSAASGADLKLLPGEVKVFSTRVDASWNWALETGSGNKRSFFDWDGASNFSNQDKRPGAKLGAYGVEAVPGWEPKAGLQTDHLSYGRLARPAATLYPYESPPNPGPAGGKGFVTMRVKDKVKFEVQPYINNPAQQIFQLDVLAGGAPVAVTSNPAPEVLLRRYKFVMSNPINEMSENPSKPIISREFTVEDILQTDPDRTSAFKKPFAMLDVTARTTKDDPETKPWLYNNFVVEGGDQNSASVGLVAQSYDIRLKQISDFDNFPDGVSMHPKSYRGYFGATAEAGLGSNFVTMFHVPVVPAASLGDLIPANLAPSSKLPRVVHPFGNSRAHPLVAAGKVSSTIAGGTALDHSYLLNDALWDKFYFSSLAAYPKGILASARSRSEVLEGALTGKNPALNSRLVAISTPDGPEKHAQYLDGLNDSQQRSAEITRSLGISGPFNVNSTSVDAWRAVLTSLRGRTVNGLEADSVVSRNYAPSAPPTLSIKSFPNADTTPFVRTGKPLAGDDDENEVRWAGFRALTDTQIKDLATNIVNEIKIRGAKDNAPSLSLAEFVNRRLGGASEDHSLAGLLQTAIDNTPDINDDAYGKDSKTLKAPVHGSRKTGIVNGDVLKAGQDNSAEGAPQILTQGDLMMALAPIATVRGDTFKIRAYGEATAPDDKSVVATAWCEVVVQRVPAFVDPTNAPETLITALTPANEKFGRRFNIVSFRWLSKEEI